MGCKNSKEVDQPLPIIDATSSGTEILTGSEESYDLKIISSIKKELDERPEIFLLNNVLMSVVFFENYEDELYDFSNQSIVKEESELNDKLENEAKKCILPDALLQKLQNNIQFYSEKRERNEQIFNKTIYIVNENIEVKDKTDKTLYDSIEVPGCQVEIEDLDESQGNGMESEKNEQPDEKKVLKESKGFLKLRVLSVTSSKFNSEQLTNRNIPINPTPLASEPSTSHEKESSASPAQTTSEDNSSDEYSAIYALNKPKRLNLAPAMRRRETLPEDCFTVRKIKKLSPTGNTELVQDTAEGQDEESDDIEEITGENQVDLYEDVTYLSSEGFMEYFRNAIFPNTPGKLLAPMEFLETLPGCILCQIKRNESYASLRIVPAVAIDWPKQALEYSHRKTRKPIIDKMTGVVYRWPRLEMIKELKLLNCVVIPKGFVMKKGFNENSDIEWEINFPKAERYLESRLSNPQVRCYIFLILLYKTFIEDSTKYHGLLIEHIRTHMFWECEADSKNWPEHKIGNKILKVIEDLNSGLSRNIIPHYFIREKNVFENIPSKYLQFSQKIFHDVLQFPVRHFIKALKNLRYVKTNFYPPLDFDVLERILREDVHERFTLYRRDKKMFDKKGMAKRHLGSRVTNGMNEVQNLKWKKRKEKLNRKKHMAKVELEKAAEQAGKVEEKDNVKHALKNLDVFKKIALLEFFTMHFIEIAKKSREIGPKNQTAFYLKQAWYNMKVLEDIGSNDTLKIEEIIIQERSQLDIAPPTPHRNMEGPRFSYNNVAKKTNSFKTDIQNEFPIRVNKKVLLKRVKSVSFDREVDKDIEE